MSTLWQPFIGRRAYLLVIAVEDKSFLTTRGVDIEAQRNENAWRKCLHTDVHFSHGFSYFNDQLPSHHRLMLFIVGVTVMTVEFL